MWAEWPSNQEYVQDLSQKLIQNLNPELHKILEDKMLNSDEAKALSDVFRNNKEMVFQITRQNLDDLRKTININSWITFVTQDDEKVIVDIAEWKVIQVKQEQKNVDKKEWVKQKIEKVENTVWDQVYWWASNEYIPWKTEKLAEVEYRQKYGEFTSNLWSKLWLPDWMINAIIHEETDFWLWKQDKKGIRRLNSDTWSKWIMQLTKWPFKDIKWDTRNKNKTDYDKVENYREIFKKINFEELKSIDMWDGKTIGDTLKPDVWEKLSKLQDPSISTKEAISILNDFQHLIKSKENKFIYFHTLEILIWSIYLSNLYNHTGWEENNKIKKASERFNWQAWDKKVAYAKRVYNYYLDEKNI